MREIKFRAWWKDREGKAHELIDNIDERPISDLRENHLIIEQFTGLHDKNGKEIYECDLVRSIHFEDAEGKTHYLIHKIVWSDIYSGWIAVSQGDKEMTPFIKAGTIQLFTYMKFAQGVEIIGNIHENPELLK